MRRLVDYFKSRNVTYVGVDTDGNCEALIPLLMVPLMLLSKMENTL
jgi:hypothetical protein